MRQGMLKKASLLIVLLIIFGPLSLPYVYAAEGDYTSIHWDTGDADDLTSMTTDGTNIWIVDKTDDEVYKFDMDGNYVNSWDTSVQANDPYGITTDGNFIWIADAVDEEVYKYTMVGAYVDSWDTSAHQTLLRGITTDGTNIWVLDFTDKEVYKYTMVGAYVDSWDTSSEGDAAWGLATDGTNIWVVDTTDKEVYKYTMAGAYTSVHWDTSGESDSPRAICTDGTWFWIGDNGDSEAYMYEYKDPPTITSAAIIDMDDTDNCYAMIFYKFTAVVDDVDGITDIEKVYLRILQESAIRGEVWATDLDTGTPTWAIESNSTIIDLNTTACSFTQIWWDYNWTKRTQLTFDNSASSENLVGFPVLVNLTSAVVSWADIQDDGDDLRFIDADNVTVLDYEIEDYNETADAAYIWVEVPQIDAGSVTDHIWMYYNNSGASSGEDAEGTWDSDYVMVQHMVDETTSTVLDSTSNDNDGAKGGANEPIETSDGQIFEAQDFDGVDDYIKVVDDNSLDLADDWVISAMILPNGTYIEVKNVISKKSTAWQNLGHDANGRLLSQIGTSNGYFTYRGTDVLSGIDFSHIVVVFDNSADTVTFYINGVLDVERVVDSGTPLTSALSLFIGGFRMDEPGSKASEFDGIIDELRMSNVTRSGEWIEAQYLSMTDSFISFGSSENPINSANVVFSVAFEWDYVAENDLELAVYVEDTSGGSAGWTTMQSNYTDAITRLVTYHFASNMTAVPIDKPIEVTGYVRYATTIDGDLASSTSPPDGQFTDVTIQNHETEIKATDTVIENGFFNVTFNSAPILRTTLYYAWLDMLDDYTDGLGPDGDYVTVTTTSGFYLSWLIEEAFNVFGIFDYLANATAYGTALGVYFVDSISNIMQLITQQFLLVMGIFDFFIDWYTRMMSLVITIGDAITGLLDGTGTITTGLGNIWDFISFSTWIDIVPVFLFIWWVESIATRGERQGEITVFFGDLSTIFNVTSWFLSMFGLVINTVTDLAFRLLGVIT